MAILKGSVSGVTVGDLLAQDLRVPLYQRPYSWAPETALQLLDDIQEAMKDPLREGVPYVLGSVILYRDDNVGAGSLDVVDGQQRLLTLRMILLLLSPDEKVSIGKPMDNPIGRVRKALRQVIEPLKKDSPENCLQLSHFIRTQCHLVRVETDDLDEAFRVFDSQNYRGKSLAPHDLLKAYHLRQMAHETDRLKMAVVETWEKTRDKDLDRLFSIYLYRIIRWSRGEYAPEFTVQDIGLLKGILPKTNLSPSACYHMAAQLAMPLLNNWEAPTNVGKGENGEDERRNFARRRFQLDAPLLAGRSFFEMVTFMLEELTVLARDGFPGEFERFAYYEVVGPNDGQHLSERPSRLRYRYVTELYLSSLLYYTNKFGVADLKTMRPLLFTWAFALRVQLQRLQYRSIDNRARGDQTNTSLFSLLRHAESVRVVRQLPLSFKVNENNVETRLLEVLNKTVV